MGTGGLVMVSKSEFMKALGELPDEATIQDAMDRLYVLYKIEQGLADIEAGRVLSDDELSARIKQWRK
jgi:predicted transcriptional regulator